MTTAPHPPRPPVPAARPITVLLVDDQDLVRTGFAMILSVEDDITVVGQAGTGAAAVDAVTELRPDVVLMDVQMPVMDGIEATRRITGATGSRVIILTTFDREDYLFDGLAAGASGFLLKNSDPDDLVDAVRAVACGHALLAPEVTVRVIERLTGTRTAADGPRGMAGSHGSAPGHAPTRTPVRTPVRTPEQEKAIARLTEREREVLGHVARGRSNAEIAADLFLGEATIKTHVSNVLAKIGSRDRVQAVVFAYETGLATPRC